MAARESGDFLNPEYARRALDRRRGRERRAGSHGGSPPHDWQPEPYAPQNYREHSPDQSARTGQFYGRGPKGYRRSDERIREEVCDRLTTHPDIDPSDLEVKVVNGIVTLVGTVEDRHEKRIAEYIAEDSLGVNDVENRLKVRHGFWAKLTGDAASDRELHRAPAPEEPQPSNVAGRASSARADARRRNEGR